MPSYVLTEKCDGCKDLERTACQYICPMDNMVLDKEKMKAYNREPEACWECYNCIKFCPVEAVVIRGYADYVPLGARITPLRGTEDIIWTVQFRDGTIKRFKYATRTIPEGQIEPYKGIEEAKKEDLKNQLLAGGAQRMGLTELATLKK